MTMMATMEEARAAEEDTVFTNVKQTRKLNKMRARTGSYSARLNAKEGKLLGPGKRLTVYKVDTIRAEVFGHFEKEVKANAALSLAAWLLDHAAVQVQEVKPQEGSPGSRNKVVFPYLSAGMALSPQVVQKAKGVPQAYLNYHLYLKDLYQKNSTLFPAIYAFSTSFPATIAQKKQLPEFFPF